MSDFRDDRLEIVAPEGIRFSLPLAGLVTRFLAWALDLLIVVVAAGVVGTALLAVGWLSSDLARAMNILAFFVLYLGYSIFFEWVWRGQSPGKRVVGIRVLDSQGLHLQFSQIAVRNLMRVVDMLPMGYLLGGLSILLSRQGQRLGDIAASTIVVTATAVPVPDLQQLLPAKYNSFRDCPHLEARLRQRVSAEETGLLVQALIRREAFDPDARVALYGELCKHFQEIVAFPERSTIGLSDEQYLRNVLESLYRKAGSHHTAANASSTRH